MYSRREGENEQVRNDYRDYLANQDGTELPARPHMNPEPSKLMVKNIKLKKLQADLADSIDVAKDQSIRNSKIFKKIKLEGSDQKIQLKISKPSENDLKRILLKTKNSNDSPDPPEYHSPKTGGHKSEKKGKFKLKVNTRYQTDKEEHENDRRQEILMDTQPRLRIFRFKQVKTCLDEDRHSKESDERQEERKRNASKKAASRYE